MGGPSGERSCDSLLGYTDQGSGDWPHQLLNFKLVLGTKEAGTGRNTNSDTQVQRLENNFQESGHSSHRVGSGDSATRLDSRDLYLLSHLASFPTYN